MQDSKIRTFDTGATRDADTAKPDYEGFLSPLVIARYGLYMHKHRRQSDGKLRDSDNWQKGIPKTQYIKSAWRHFVDWWGIHRKLWSVGYDGGSIEDVLCGVMFNVMGYLHEHLREASHDREVRTNAPRAEVATLPAGGDSAG